ncbi:hypothetical protein M5D96_009521 [Drosophila gunungcola]|uniref:Uncharacterized protein n=1 Tax=Drosophila gunungcola TaxID=103775 RepID=A0A9Q0BM91_9MUSC|nr:hypothetical protein M5D96_009521 [Drosophila gunungcola]
MSINNTRHSPFGFRFRFALLVLAAWCCYLGNFGSEAHVALTYPPARKFDLDFLDNARTKAPCGMPKGKCSAGSFVCWESDLDFG